MRYRNPNPQINTVQPTFCAAVQWVDYYTERGWQTSIVVPPKSGHQFVCTAWIYATKISPPDPEEYSTCVVRACPTCYGHRDQQDNCPDCQGTGIEG
jgi:hypothetical protein